MTLALGGLLLLSGIATGATMPFRAILGVEVLGMSEAAFAVLITLGSLAAAGASLALGGLSDRLPDRRWTVLVSAGIGVPAYGLICLSQSVWGFVLAYGALLPFAGALFSQSFSYGRSYFDDAAPDRAEQMMAVLRSVFSMAWVLTPPVAGWLAGVYSPYAAFWLAAGAHLAATGLVLGLIRLGPTPPPGGPPPRAGIGAALGAVPARQRWGIAGLILVWTGTALHHSAMPLAITTDLGGSYGDVGRVAGLAALIEVPLMLAWGWAVGPLGKGPILAFCGLAYAAYLVAVMLATSVTQILWLQLLNGLAIAGIMGVSIAYLQDAISGRLGLSTSLMDIVAVTSAILASALFALLAGPGSYGWSLGVTSAMVVLGALLIWPGRRGG